MEIVSWNVQAARGVDGRVDIERIAEVIAAPGIPDVICLQEVAQCYPEIDAGHGTDQVAALAVLFPEHEVYFGAALDRRGEGRAPRRRFGNLVLSRPAVEQVFLHPLPQPPDASVRHMPRQATEVVIGNGERALRIVTLHLEFHSRTQRTAQVARLLALQLEAGANVAEPPRYDASGPYAAAPRPVSAVYCGDFNFGPADPEYAAMVAPAIDPAATLFDAWVHRYGAVPHRPTCGIYDHVQWPEGPHCRDFFFVTDDVLAGVEAVTVNEETAASDHQPVRLDLSLAPV